MQSIENSTYKGDTLKTSAMNIPIKHPIPWDPFPTGNF